MEYDFKKPTVWAINARMVLFFSGAWRGENMNGRIFKVESMGMHDGPGIRTVIFLSGCKLRCKYCHNPESWTNSGEEISSAELIKKIIKFKPYFERSGGGVTFSGGEPLLQAEFLKEMLKLCKNEGIHTCIDTAGVGNCTTKEYEEILSFTDLVLFDVKATEEKEYKAICEGEISHAEIFISALKKVGTPVIIRQVMVPGINDTEEYLVRLREYIKCNFSNVIKTEILPYHKMAEGKYKELGIVSPFCDIPPMDKAKTECFEKKYFG